jgi:hypothetical protein
MGLVGIMTIGAPFAAAASNITQAAKFYDSCMDPIMNNLDNDGLSWQQSVTEHADAGDESDMSPLTQHMAFYCGLCQFLQGSPPPTSTTEAERANIPRYFDLRGAVLHCCFIFLVSAVLPTLAKKFGPNHELSVSHFLRKKEQRKEYAPDTSVWDIVNGTQSEEQNRQAGRKKKTRSASGELLDNEDSEETIQDKAFVCVSTLPTTYCESMHDAEESEDELNGLLDTWLVDNAPKFIRVPVSRVLPTLSNSMTAGALGTAIFAYYQHYAMQDRGNPISCWFNFVVAMPFYPPIVLPFIKLVIKVVKLMELGYLNEQSVFAPKDYIAVEVDVVPAQPNGIAEAEEVATGGKVLAEKVLAGATGVSFSSVLCCCNVASAAADGASTASAAADMVGDTVDDTVENVLGSMSDHFFEGLGEICDPWKTMVNVLATVLAIGGYAFVTLAFAIPAMVLFFPVTVVALINLTVWTTLMVAVANLVYVVLFVIIYSLLKIVKLSIGAKAKGASLVERLRDEYRWIDCKLLRSFTWSKIPSSGVASFGFSLGFAIIMFCTGLVQLVTYLTYPYAGGFNLTMWTSTANAVLGTGVEIGHRHFSKFPGHSWAYMLYHDVFWGGKLLDLPKLVFPEDFTFDTIFFVFHSFDVYNLSIFLGYSAFALDFSVEAIFEPLLNALYNVDRADAKQLMRTVQVLTQCEEEESAEGKQSHTSFKENLRRALDTSFKENTHSEESGVSNIYRYIVRVEGCSFKKFNNKSAQALEAFKSAFQEWLEGQPKKTTGGASFSIARVKARKWSAAMADMFQEKQVDGKTLEGLEVAELTKTLSTLTNKLQKDPKMKHLFADRCFHRSGIGSLSVGGITCRRIKAGADGQDWLQTVLATVDRPENAPGRLMDQAAFKERKNEVLKLVEGNEAETAKILEGLDVDWTSLNLHWSLQIKDTLGELHGENPLSLKTSNLPQKTRDLMVIRHGMIHPSTRVFSCAGRGSAQEQERQVEKGMRESLDTLQRMTPNRDSDEILELARQQYRRAAPRTDGPELVDKYEQQKAQPGGHTNQRTAHTAKLLSAIEAYSCLTIDIRNFANALLSQLLGKMNKNKQKWSCCGKPSKSHSDEEEKASEWKLVVQVLTLWLHRADVVMLRKELEKREDKKRGKRSCFMSMCFCGDGRPQLKKQERKAIREELRKTDYYSKVLHEVSIGTGTFEQNKNLLATLDSLDTGADGDEDAEADYIQPASASDPIANFLHVVPAPPTNVQAIGGDGMVTLMFDKPSSDGGETITSYIVRWDDTNLVCDGTTGRVVVPGLVNGRSYVFGIHARNRKGESLMSAVSTVTATPIDPMYKSKPIVSTSKSVGAIEASPPIDVHAVSADGEVTVHFQRPESNGGNTITSFVVRSHPDVMEWECTPEEAFTWQSTRALGAGIFDQAAVVVSGLTNGLPFMFSVRAVTIAGEGEWSGWSNTVTPQASLSNGLYTTLCSALNLATFQPPLKDEAVYDVVAKEFDWDEKLGAMDLLAHLDTGRCMPSLLKHLHFHSFVCTHSQIHKSSNEL